MVKVNGFASHDKKRENYRHGTSLSANLKQPTKEIDNFRVRISLLSSLIL
jgi:hypothetical protein